MAVRRTMNLVSQMRIDVPHLRSIESAVSNDFDELIQSLMGEDKSYVLRGFELNMIGAVGAPANALQMVVAEGSILHGNSSVSGTFLVVPSGTPNETLNPSTNTSIDGSFTPGSSNYIGIEYDRSVDETTLSQVYIWNPSTKTETIKTLPLAKTLDYKIVISSASFASNVLPIAIVNTNASNNVESIEDRRPLLFRLGTAGTSTPNPFYKYPWTNHAEGRVENFWSSSSATSPFRGGDKQILTDKEWRDAVMSCLLEVKGTPFWYSTNVGGSIIKLRFDLANTAVSGTGSITHNATTPGKINWNSDVYLNLVGSRLSYKINSNAASNDIVMSDNDVAYINLVRGIDVIPNLVFTNGSPTVTSLASVPWTASLQDGDYIKLAAADDTLYYEIANVVSNTEVTLVDNYDEISTGPGGTQAQYAFGVYETNAVPSTNRHVWVEPRKDVTLSEDNYWLFLRSDNGGATPRVYVRFMGMELEQGEERQINDNTSVAVLTYSGMSNESDSTPDYTNAITTGVAEETTFTFPAAASITDGQSFTINSAFDTNEYYIWFNKDGGGADPLIAGRIAIEVAIATGNTNLQVATAVHGMIGVLPDFNSADNADGTITVTNVDVGATTDAANVDVGGVFAVNVDTQGAGEYNHYVVDNENLTQGIKRLDSQVFDNREDIDSLFAMGIQDQNIALIGGDDWTWDLPTTTLASSSNAYIQVPGLPHNRNTILAGSSALLDVTDKVLYVTINRTTGPSDNLTVQSGLISALSLGDDDYIIARRVGDTVYVRDKIAPTFLAALGLDNESDMPTYSSDIRGVAAEGLKNRIETLTDAIGDEQEDRSAFLRSDEVVVWDGASLSFTSDIELKILNTKSGTITTHTILVAGSPISLTDGQIAYITIDRTIDENNAVTIAASLPAQTQATKDVIPLFQRIDTGGAGYLHIPLHKQVLEPGQSVLLGASGSGGGEGSSFGLLLDELPYRIGFKDTFDDQNLIDSSETTASYSAANKAFVVSYDGDVRGYTEGTDLILDSAPAFTVVIGDLIVATINGNKEIRKITVVGTINTDGGVTTPATISSAFSSPLGLAEALVLDAELFTKMNAHAADGAEHFSGGVASPDAVNFPLVALSTDLASLIISIDEKIAAYNPHEIDSQTGAGTFHNGGAAPAYNLTFVTTAATLKDCFDRLNDIKDTFNDHDADTTSHTTGSLHQIVGADVDGTSCLISQKVQTEDGMHYYDSSDPESRPSSELVGHIDLTRLSWGELYNIAGGQLPGNSCRDIYVDGSEIFVATDNGVAHYDGAAWNTYNVAGGQLPDNDCYGVYAHSGEIFVATFAAGVAHFDGAVWNTYNVVGGELPGDSCRGIYADSGEIFVATNAGAAHYDGALWNTYNVAGGQLPSDTCSDIYAIVGAATEIFVSTNAGAAHYDGVWNTYNLAGGELPSNTCTAIHANGSEIFVATNIGVAHYDGALWNTYSAGSGDLPANLCTDVYANGSEIFVTTNAGVGHYDGAAWNTYDVAGGELPSDDCLSIYESSGEIFVGTNVGTTHYDGDTFSHAEQPEWLTPQVNDIILQYTGGVLYESYITRIDSTTEFVVNDWTNLNNGVAFIIRPSQMASYLVDYRDDGFVDSVNVAFAAITDADATTAWADEYALTRNLNAADENPTRNIVGTTGAHFFLRFFANIATGTGTVTLYEYDSAMYEEPQFNNSGVHNQAYGRTDGAGTEINCVVSTPLNTRITLADDFPSFVSGVNAGNPFGDLIVHLDGQEIPRYVDATLTPNASYVEDPNGLFITLDSDYSGSSLSVSIVRRVGSVDTSSQNTTEISKLNNFTVQVQNAAYNIDSDDDLIIVSGVTTVTLPDPLLRRKPLYVKRNDAANTTTIARNSGENIDGTASDVTITTDLETVALVSDGTDWWVL